MPYTHSDTTSTQRDIAEFRDQGFLRFDGLISGKELSSYKQLLDGLVERSLSMVDEEEHFSLHYDENNQSVPGVLHKVQGVCVVEPGLLELAREPAIVEKVEALIGRGVDIFGTKYFPMVPNGGTSTDWHQDNYYFGKKTNGSMQTDDEIVTCGIYFEDTDRSNGCLRLVPGSHKEGNIVEHAHRPGVYGHGNWADVDDSVAVDVECPAGTVLLFSANLLHAAHRNTSRNRTRYSTAWHYISSDLPLANFPKGEYADRHTITAHA
jgi:phytanoyl-CoA hydroxylase